MYTRTLHFHPCLVIQAPLIQSRVNHLKWLTPVRVGPSDTTSAPILPACPPELAAHAALPGRWLPAHERQANSNEFLVGYGRENSQRNNSSFRGRDSFDDANLDSSEMRGHFPEALNFNWLILKLNQFMCEERSIGSPRLGFRV
jgi:hypothetical protein